MEEFARAVEFEAEYQSDIVDQKLAMWMWNGGTPNREEYWQDIRCHPGGCDDCKHNGCPWDQRDPYWTGDSGHC